MVANKLETGMSKINMFGRITRLLVSACVVPAGLGLCILQTEAAGMPGSARSEAPCGDTAGRSTDGSTCDCPHCREVNSSDSRLLRFLKSRCTKTKWAERTPKHTWKCYHPCPPYFEPTFGIHQTSWTILQHDASQVPFATPLVNSNNPLPSHKELHPSPPAEVQPAAQPDAQPAAQPEVLPELLPELLPEALPKSQVDAPGEARIKARPRRVTPVATKISPSDSRRHSEQRTVVAASGTNKKIELPQTSTPQKSVSRADFPRRSLLPTEAPAAASSSRSPKLAPLNDVQITDGAARPVSPSVAPNKAVGFDKQTPDSLFTSHNDPLFRTKPAAGTSAVSHMK